MSPVLTLAIPSRRVPDTLFASLIKIRNEIESLDLDGFFEILVSLNPSTSIETIPHPLLDLVENYGRVIKAPGDLSFDEHINFMMSEARGSWVKFIADDDELIEGALAVLERIITMYPNLKCLAHDFDYWQPGDSQIQLLGLRNLKRGEMPGPWGQISTTLFSRDSWIEAPNPQYSEYIHSFKFEYIASMNINEALYLPQKLAKVRPGSPNFSSNPFMRSYVAGQALGGIKDLMTCEADAFLTPKRIKHNIVYFLRTLAYSRAEGARGLLPLGLKAVRLWPTYLLAWVAIPLCITPRFVLNVFRQHRGNPISPG